MNILIPIDFSPAAMHAYDYAKNLATHLNARLIALHVCEEKDLYHEVLASLKLEESKKKLIRITRNYPNKEGVELNGTASTDRLVRVGRVVDEIVKTCDEESVDMIILGTRAKHFLPDYLFGSVSTQLIKKVSCPILIIPEESPIREVKQMTLATKINEVHPEVLTYAGRIANRLNATLDQLNVSPFKFCENDEKEFVINHFGSAHNENQQLTIVRDVSLQRGLQYFFDQHKTDVLILYVPEKKTWWEEIKRNFKKRIVYRSKFPLLIINSKTC